MVAELLQRGCPVSALARDVSTAGGIPSEILVEGNVLQPETLAAACVGVDVVISCLGSRYRTTRSCAKEVWPPIDVFSPGGYRLEAVFTDQDIAIWWKYSTNMRTNRLPDRHALT